LSSLLALALAALAALVAAVLDDTAVDDADTGGGELLLVTCW